MVLQFDKDITSPLPPGEGQGEGLSVANLSRRYFWQPNAVDQLMTDEQVTTPSQPGNVLLTLTDNLGTVRDLATFNSTTGVTSVVNHRVYDSYGNLESQTNAAVDCLFGWTGRAYDTATGLQNNVNRWYDAKVGRWASEDPDGFTAGDANTYRYVGNSPTNWIDPSGLDDKPPVGGPDNGYNGTGTWQFKNKKDLIKFLTQLLNANQPGFPANWVETAENGCIGLANLRIGLQNGHFPLSPMSYKGAEFYLDLSTALTRLKALNNNTDGKKWLLVAIQVPVTKDVKKLIAEVGTNKVDLNKLSPYINLDEDASTQYNWATWFESGYWEYMNGNWKKINPDDLPTVKHRTTLPDMSALYKGTYLTIYMIVQQRGYQ
jgi:RHS repeat-associated protein